MAGNTTSNMFGGVIEEDDDEDYSETLSIPTTLASSEMGRLELSEKRTHFEVYRSVKCTLHCIISMWSLN